MERWLFAIVVRSAAPSWRTRTTAWSAWRTTRPVFHKQPNRPVAQKQHNQPVLKHRAKSSFLVGKDAEPAEQPPDVPVPPAAAVQLRQRRSGDDGWPRLQMPSGDGYIRLSMNSQFVWDTRACCEGCNATLSRTCKPSWGARPGSRASGQGRPLGKLWAWLLWAAQNPGHSAEDHRAYVPDLAARQSARRDVSRPEMQAQQWMDSECPGHVLGIDLEDGEPLHVP